MAYYFDESLKQNIKTFTLKIRGTPLNKNCDHQFMISLHNGTHHQMIIELNKSILSKKKSLVQQFNPSKVTYLNSEKLIMDCTNDFLLNFEISDEDVTLFTYYNKKRYIFGIIQTPIPVTISNIQFKIVDDYRTFNVQIRNLGKFYI